MIFKNCAPFTDSICETNNIWVDNARDSDGVMSVYNLIEYRDTFLKTSVSLWQYYRDEPALNNDSNTNDFHANNNTVSFKFKEKITGQTNHNSI